MSVVTNVSALVAHRAVTRATDSMSRSIERLSSGHRINRAADDAAGLAISRNLHAQVTGMGQAIRNTQDGISVVRTAEGALDAATSVLQRMRDLSVQAANDGGLTDSAEDAIQKEIAQLKNELDRIGTTTTFNGRPLLDGTYRGTFQVGANAGEAVTVVIGSTGLGIDAAGLGLESVDVTEAASSTSTVIAAISDAEGVPTAGRVVLGGDFTTSGVYEASFAGLTGSITYDGKTFDLGSVDYTGAVTATDYITRLNLAALPFFGTSHTPFTGAATGLTFTGATPGVGSTAADAVTLTPTYAGRSGASRAISLIDDAVQSVSSLRAYLGAMENRFEHISSSLAVTLENTTASVSRISDADLAWEMTRFTRGQILSEAGTAMLAQANRRPQTVLALLS
ncbi:flagellin N-terminal helical domain-containing protein [Blastococcus deserti]|uniref:Flagellin n=1 Tax=Blastococcus deserti TaxID=2259033 RepID=A0ABW4XA57_9ACTN